ncbi:MAG: MFS transporter, partial [Legionellales bacterium]
MNGKKVTFLTSIGAGLEYYDFVIYGMMAPYLSSLFFVSGDASSQLIKTFAIFAVGYLFRPLGGIFFGLLADRFGRKKSFLTVMLIMASATFGIGLLPTYSSIGGMAVVLLIICRILQGISFGAEIPGAITIVSEFNAKNKGIHCGLVISSTAIGSTLAALVLYLLSSNLDKDIMAAWGWRIPFLLGGLLAVVSYVMRSKLRETPEFTRNVIKHQSMLAPLKL